MIAISLFLGLGRYLFFWISGKASLLDYELTPTSPVVIDRHFHFLRLGPGVVGSGTRLANFFTKLHHYLSTNPIEHVVVIPLPVWPTGVDLALRDLFQAREFPEITGLNLTHRAKTSLTAKLPEFNFGG